MSRALGHALWVAILIQIFAVAWKMSPWIAPDTTDYLQLADGLARGFYGTSNASGNLPDVLRPPGLPLTLWLSMHVLGLPTLGVVMIQLGCYLLSIFLIDRWLVRRGVQPIFFRFVAAVYPFAAAYSAQILTEAWMMLALTAIGLLLASRGVSPARFAAMGAIAGVAAMFRSDLLLLPVLVLVIAAWRAIGLRQTAVGFLGSAVIPLLLPFAVILAPYVTWNMQNFGKPSPAPMAAAFGNSIYTAYWQEVLPQDDMTAMYNGIVTKKAVDSGWAGEIMRVNLSIGAPALTPPDNPSYAPTNQTRMRSGPAFGRAALNRIADDPGRYVWHVAKNVVLLWNTSRFEGIPAPIRAALTGISYLVFSLGMLGLFRTFIDCPRGWPLARSTALVMLYPFVVHLPGHLEARYTAASRPLLLMFAAMSLAWLFDRARERAKVEVEA